MFFRCKDASLWSLRKKLPSGIFKVSIFVLLYTVYTKDVLNDLFETRDIAQILVNGGS